MSIWSNYLMILVGRIDKWAVRSNIWPLYSKRLLRLLWLLRLLRLLWLLR